jgi:PAS domain S-box-containing protein
MKLKRGKNFRPYAAAIGAVVLATVVTCGWKDLRTIHSMALYMIAVVLTAFYGGLLPSVAAIVLSSLSFAFFIAPPPGLAIGSADDRTRLEFFIIITFLISFLQAQRIKAEDKARSLAQRLSLALEGTKLGAWDLDLTTGVVWHSSTLEEIFARGADRFAISYEVFLGYVHGEDRDFVHRTVTRCIESGGQYHIQYRILHPNGDVRWVGTRGRVYFDEKKKPERLVAVTTDITDQPGVGLSPSAAKARPAMQLAV